MKLLKNLPAMALVALTTASAQAGTLDHIKDAFATAKTFVCDNKLAAGSLAGGTAGFAAGLAGYYFGLMSAQERADIGGFAQFIKKFFTGGLGAMQMKAIAVTLAAIAGGASQGYVLVDLVDGFSERVPEATDYASAQAIFEKIEIDLASKMLASSFSDMSDVLGELAVKEAAVNVPNQDVAAHEKATKAFKESLRRFNAVAALPTVMVKMIRTKGEQLRVEDLAHRFGVAKLVKKDAKPVLDGWVRFDYVDADGVNNRQSKLISTVEQYLKDAASLLDQDGKIKPVDDKNDGKEAFKKALITTENAVKAAEEKAQKLAQP